MSKSVYIANLNPGEVRNEYHASLIDLILHDIKTHQHIAAYVPRKAGGCLGIYRSIAVDHFLGFCNDYPTTEWLLFFDADIQMPIDTLDRLMEYADPTETPIIAGTYYMPLDEAVVPSVFDYKLDDDGRKHMIPRYVATPPT